MIDAKTAKQRSDDLNNKNNEANLAIIEKLIVEATNTGKYSVVIDEKNINEIILNHLRELGYKITKNSGFYDQRYPQGSVEPYYTIAWG